jgi:hypothetical protein
MQIAQKVEDVLRTKPVTRKADHFKIPFVRVAPPKPLSKAEILRRQKMRWFAAVGYKPGE